MSRTFSANAGSDESWKPSVRCGLRPKARQTRCTVAGDRPHSAAMERVLQCVAPLGHRLQGPDEQVGDPLVGDGARGAAPGLVAQPVEPVLGEALAPLANRVRADADV